MQNYLIISEDKVIIDDNITKILKDNNLTGENLIKYDMSEVLLDNAIEELNTYSLFIENKVVVLYNCDFLQSANKRGSLKQDETLLIDYINNPNPLNILIIISSSIDDRLKINKLLKEKTKVIETSFSIEDKIKLYLDDYTMDNRTINYLISYLNKNNTRILNEINKLKIYKDNDKNITIDDINEIVVREFDDDIFSLINAVVKKDKNRAYNIFKELTSRGEEVTKIIITLADQFRLIYRVKVLINSGKNKDYIASFLKVHPYRVKLATESSYNFTEDELLAYLKKLSSIDIDIKTGNIVSDFSFEMFLLELY